MVIRAQHERDAFFTIRIIMIIVKNIPPRVITEEEIIFAIIIIIIASLLLKMTGLLQRDRAFCVTK